MSSVGMAEMVVATPSETVTTGVTVDGRPVESTVIHASVASARSCRAGVGSGAGTAWAALMSIAAAVSSLGAIIFD